MAAPGAEADIEATRERAASAPLFQPASAASAPDAAEAPTATLPGVTVKAKVVRNAAETQPDATRATTTVGPREIERRQAASVFELLDGVPGTAVTGGPRPSGMSFNIRGYTDGEDVAVKVDGAVKGFEKYRYGGTFIEPDLLKTLEVQRGAQIESGAGSLGGTVNATTRDAADLLRPGQRFGLRVRTGHASANDERHQFVAVYGRPSDPIDLLAALTRRLGDDIELPDGTELAHSSLAVDSRLLKASWFPADGWKASLSHVDYTDSGLQPYDTTAGPASVGGLVRRSLHDRTLTLNLQYADDDGRREARLSLGRSHTRVHDRYLPGLSGFASVATGEVQRNFDYRIHTLDASGRVRLLDGRLAGWRQQLHLKAGWQMGRNQRAVIETRELQATDGFYGAQPPGTKRNRGVYLQPQWTWGRLTLMPGVRHDRYVIAAESNTAAKLAAAGEPTQARYEQTSPHLAAAFDLLRQDDGSPWTLFANAARAFRPPLIDEIYTESAFGRCVDATLSLGYTVPGYPQPDRATLRRLAGANLYGPSSKICGSLYRPETSRSVEWGLSTQQRAPFGPGSTLSARLTLFRDRTQALLETLSFVPRATLTDAAAYDQPGWEQRHGQEFEAGWQVATPHGTAFGRLSYSRVRGQAYDRSSPPTFSLHPLDTAPADTAFASLGWRWAHLEAVLRWQRVADRRTLAGSQRSQTCSAGTGALQVVTQPGYHLLGASLRWPISPYVELSLAGENLEDARYCLNDGFGGGIGTQGPGRNLRISLGVQY